MSVWDDLMADDGILFTDPDVMGGEAITYTPYIAGVAQAAIPGYAQIDRSATTQIVSEVGGAVTKILHMEIPRSITGTVNLNDGLTAAWKVGDPPSNFRVIERLNQDTGMTRIIAEMSIN